MAHIKKEFDDITENKNWDKLFHDLREFTKGYMDQYPTSSAAKDINLFKNRYRDVLPFDSTRVKLQVDADQPQDEYDAELNGDADYINASFVHIEKANRKYILTQGPLEHTVGDFWHMIWEQQCPAIIMLNKLNENSFIQNKCHPYVPTEEADSIVVDSEGTSITCISKVQMPCYIRSDLEIDRGGSGAVAADKVSLGKRRVIHYQYTEWPDFGVPACPDSFLEFLGAIRASGALDDTENKPIAVHCSAGIGRSGTFIMVDTCLLMISRNVKVNVISLLIDLRQYRYGLVQTAEQLRFTYQTIINGIEKFIGPLPEVSARLTEPHPRIAPLGVTPNASELYPTTTAKSVGDSGGGSSSGRSSTNGDAVASSSDLSTGSSGAETKCAVYADTKRTTPSNEKNAPAGPGPDKDRPLFRRQAGRYDSNAAAIEAEQQRRNSVTNTAAMPDSQSKPAAAVAATINFPSGSSTLNIVAKAADVPPSTPLAHLGSSEQQAGSSSSKASTSAASATAATAAAAAATRQPQLQSQSSKKLPMPKSYPITQNTPSPRPSSSSSSAGGNSKSSSGGGVEKLRLTPSPTAPLAGTTTAPHLDADESSTSHNSSSDKSNGSAEQQQQHAANVDDNGAAGNSAAANNDNSVVNDDAVCPAPASAAVASSAPIRIDNVCDSSREHDAAGTASSGGERSDSGEKQTSSGSSIDSAAAKLRQRRLERNEQLQNKLGGMKTKQDEAKKANESFFGRHSTQFIVVLAIVVIAGSSLLIVGGLALWHLSRNAKIAR